MRERADDPPRRRCAGLGWRCGFVWWQVFESCGSLVARSFGGTGRALGTGLRWEDVRWQVVRIMVTSPAERLVRRRSSRRQVAPSYDDMSNDGDWIFFGDASIGTTSCGDSSTVIDGMSEYTGDTSSLDERHVLKCGTFKQPALPLAALNASRLDLMWKTLRWRSASG